MKRWLVGLAVTVMMVSCSFCVYAAPGKHDDYRSKGRIHNQQVREDARYIIHRSAMVLIAAQRAAGHRHQYFGLARAFAHQRKAKELYENGLYREAIFHSLRARDLGFQIIRDNRGRPEREFFRDDLEERYNRESPRDNDLDMSLDKKNVGKDDEAVRLHFNIDISN